MLEGPLKEYMVIENNELRQCHVQDHALHFFAHLWRVSCLGMMVQSVFRTYSGIRERGQTDSRKQGTLGQQTRRIQMDRYSFFT